MPLGIDGYGLLPIADADPASYAVFSCGKPHLDEFLVKDALPMHRARLGFTTIVYHQDVAGAVAFFTLAHDAIPLKDSEQFAFGLEYKLSSFPAVKLCRLGVAIAHQGSGVGAAVLSLLFGQILDTNYPSSARLIVVDADNDERVIRFYEREGFASSLWAQEQATKALRGRPGPGPTAVKMHRDILATA